MRFENQYILFLFTLYSLCTSSYHSKVSSNMLNKTLLVVEDPKGWINVSFVSIDSHWMHHECCLQFCLNLSFGVTAIVWTLKPRSSSSASRVTVHAKKKKSPAVKWLSLYSRGHYRRQQRSGVLVEFNYLHFVMIIVFPGSARETQGQS